MKTYPLSTLATLTGMLVLVGAVGAGTTVLAQANQQNQEQQQQEQEQLRLPEDMLQSLHQSDDVSVYKMQRAPEGKHAFVVIVSDDMLQEVMRGVMNGMNQMNMNDTMMNR